MQTKAKLFLQNSTTQTLRTQRSAPPQSFVFDLSRRKWFPVKKICSSSLLKKNRHISLDEQWVLMSWWSWVWCNAGKEVGTEKSIPCFFSVWTEDRLCPKSQMQIILNRRQVKKNKTENSRMTFWSIISLKLRNESSWWTFVFTVSSLSGFGMHVEKAS